MEIRPAFVPCPVHWYGYSSHVHSCSASVAKTARCSRRQSSFRRVRTISSCAARQGSISESGNESRLSQHPDDNHLISTTHSDKSEMRSWPQRQRPVHQRQKRQERQNSHGHRCHDGDNFEIYLYDDDEEEALHSQGLDNTSYHHHQRQQQHGNRKLSSFVITSGKDPTPSPSNPPPGREDEFADSNGDSLQERESEGSKVATLERDLSFDTVLQELSAIQQDGPRNVAILGTRHTSYLHQQIIELLTYANVLVGNHVFTSGAGGTNAAVIKGALRAERPDLLTVVLPQSLVKQPTETQDQLRKVTNLIEMKKNDPLPLDVASQLCNSDILSRCTHFIAFAFHDSDVVLEAVRQAKELRIVVTVMYLD